MAIRGFRDLGPNERNQRLVNPQGMNGQYSILGYGMGLGTSEEARHESFGKMLKFIFCPYFSYLSFIFLISMVDIVLYFITVFYSYDTKKFLEPKWSTLYDFGGESPSALKDGELWRLVMPIMLHANLIHLAFNVTVTLIIGFRLEPTVGMWRTIAVYFLSGIGGNLFSALIGSSDLSVGASGAILGMISSMISWIIINWRPLGDDPNRFITIIWLSIFLIFNLLWGASISDHTDNWAHLGGAIFGFGLGFLFFNSIDPTASMKMIRIGSFIYVGLLFFLFFVLFYTT